MLFEKVGLVSQLSVLFFIVVTNLKSGSIFLVIKVLKFKSLF